MKRTQIKLVSKWYDDNLQFAKWSDSSSKILKLAFFRLRESIIRKLGAYCMHLKGRGGIKGSVRCIYNKINSYPYAARFDIESFYGSINHKVLFRQLDKLNIDPSLMLIIRDYVKIPDTDNKGIGIVAGGALSTLLGAVYFLPLDKTMIKLYKKGSVFYLHYVDDIVILAKTRWKFKEAIKLMHKTLDSLQISVHTQEKRFVGKTSKGFDFLGYYFKTGRKVKPSKKSMERFSQRARQLLEQGDLNRLLSYAEKFLCYVIGGLKYCVSLKRLRKYIKFIDYKLDCNLTEKIMLLC